jgi:ribosomal protein S18 acetylase RimI-like enzyme
VVRQNTAGVEFLQRADQSALQAFYDQSYPGNWFDPRMLETGQYVGVREAGAIRCAAGIHVFSAQYGVAALGNIATDPRARRRGLAKRATARLCQSLLEHLDTISLNVKADNIAAIRCYEALGFSVIAEYDEFMVERIRA